MGTARQHRRLACSDPGDAASVRNHGYAEGEMDLDGVKAFHGHWCPGLALGIRVSEAALLEMGPHAQDEEIVAIVEADNCAVDAIQYLTGCTFGKGNLIHLDYGKNAFTFVRRSDGKAVRVVVRTGAWGRPSAEDGTPPEDAEAGQAPSEALRRTELDRVDRAQWILDASLEDILDVRRVDRPIPRRARVHESVACSSCGEHVMETRARLFRGEVLCIPCFEGRERRV